MLIHTVRIVCITESVYHRFGIREQRFRITVNHPMMLVAYFLVGRKARSLLNVFAQVISGRRAALRYRETVFSTLEGLDSAFFELRSVGQNHPVEARVTISVRILRIKLRIGADPTFIFQSHFIAVYRLKSIYKILGREIAVSNHT